MTENICSFHALILAGLSAIGGMGRKLVFLVAGCLCFLKQDLSWSSWCIFILKVLLPYMYIYIYMFIYVYTFGHVWPLQQSAF